MGGKTPDFDVVIIGAGISGISMAVHMSQHCPDQNLAIFEQRENAGGTWDLFRYPGVRSDSDMYTLGFGFEPWREEKSIAEGGRILAYLNDVIDSNDVRSRIRFGHRLLSADWCSADAQWVLTLATNDGQQVRVTARYLYMGSGYYDYDAGHNPDIPGTSDFAGQIIHPQFWPPSLDVSGKRVVIIGSGATAVTLLPNLARDAAHVTMLQRTPTYYISRPARDGFARFLQNIMPARWAYAAIRARNVFLQNMLFSRSRRHPEKVGRYLINEVRKALGGKMNAADWTPPYNPWEQRLCLVPDGDLFAAVRSGKADVVTDKIARIDANGIALQSGRHLDADIIVTATGLKIALAGKAAFSIDGAPIRWNEHFYYKGTMFSNVPNLSLVFGYLNASWTLKADLVAEFTCRILNHMRAGGFSVAVPRLDDASAQADEVVFDFSSGYLSRAIDQFPRNGTADPWRINQDYLHDRRFLRTDPVDDGVLHFSSPADQDGQRVASLADTH